MTLPRIQNKQLFYEALHPRMDVPRENVLEDVDRQLRKSGRFVVLLGDSGGGKSHFLRNTLVPYFEGEVNEEADEKDAPWRVVSFLPQINPIGMLANALAQPGVLKEDSVIQPFFRQQLEQQLRRGEDGLVNIYRDADVETADKFRLLIIVDQLEDIFLLGDELYSENDEVNEKRKADNSLFFDLFLQVVKTEIPVYLIFSVGSESLDRFNAFQEWPERINRHRYALPQLSSLDVDAALKAPRPEEDRPSTIPKGLTELYGLVTKDYKKQSAKKKELPTRVNMVLELLQQYSLEILAEPFGTLKDAPEFITEALKDPPGTKGTKSPGEKGALIVEGFKASRNREDWDERMAKLQSDKEEFKKWESGIEDFFTSLQVYYEKKIGGLNGAPNLFFDKAHEKFKPEEEALIKRLFQAITFKDPSPEVVARSYAVPLKVLREICFRNGEEYPEVLKTLKQMGFKKKSKITDPTDDVKVQDEQLRKVIDHYNFTGEVIPEMIRCVNLYGTFGEKDEDKPKLNDDTLIKLGNSSLLQEWGALEDWVNEEYTAATLYRKLTEDAQVYYQQEPGSSETTEKRPAIPNISIFSFFKEIWAMFTGFVREKMTPKDKQRGEDDKVKEEDQPSKREDFLLSQGRVELFGEWFFRTKPSSKWGAKYRPKEIIRDEDIGEGEGLPDWVKEHGNEAFPMARKFWGKSQATQSDRIEAKEEKTKQEIKVRRRFARRMGWLAAFAGVLVVVAGVLGWQANQARNDLRLLDFVDIMTKANIIPSNIYRKAYFRSLKDNIEKNRKIKDNAAVVDALAGWGVLKFKEENPNSGMDSLSKAALLQLDPLINNYNDTTTTALTDLSTSIIGLAYDAARYNKTTTDTNYQFPYVYQVLWENYGALKSALKTDTDDRGFVFKTPARISAVESNPVVADQYAVADAAGRVRIFRQGDRVMERIVPIPESISSMLYTFSGRYLYVSTFAGNIYHYQPLASVINEQSPVGYGDSLQWNKLRVDWRRRGDDLAILSIHNTALEDHLLVMGDVDITLIKRINGYRYREVQNIPLGEELTALTVTEGNEDGTKFIVGGSDASALISFDPATKTLTKVRTVEHRNTSVSAIAFQPISASRARAQNSGEPISQKVAIGTETGDIWMTDISSYSATGPREVYLMDIINEKAKTKDTLNYQESAITRLFFNETEAGINGVEQLISSSLDGSIWLFNLGVIPQKTNYFFEKTANSGSWDHLQLSTTGRSVNNICLVNKDKIIAIENNAIRNWPTNMYRLKEKVEELLIDYQSGSQ